jgi:hypothetical protein
MDQPSQTGRLACFYHSPLQSHIAGGFLDRRLYDWQRHFCRISQTISSQQELVRRATVSSEACKRLESGEKAGFDTSGSPT